MSPALGAVVEGVHLGPAMDDGTVMEIREALLGHKVLWFRDQSLDAISLTTVAARFGTPTEAHPVEPSLEGHPEVLPLDSDEGARADVWHSDLTFQERPPLGAMLHALEIPPVGGDTIWADMTGAYMSLSETLRGFVDGLTASHSPGNAGAYFAARDATGGEAAVRAAATSTRHPVVRVHPETGERSLFVNPLFTTRSTDCAGTKATPCWPFSMARPLRRSDWCGGSGKQGTWRSGTTAAPCTTPCWTSEPTGGGCSGWRSKETDRSA